MIKVSVFYPNEAGVNFDMEYYCNQHMQLVKEKVGSALLNTGVDAGMCGPAPEAPATYVAIGHLFFESPETFGAAFGPVAADIQADVPNFTNAQPIVQISEVKV